MIDRRRLVLTSCFALWGLATAVSLQSVLITPAPADQAVGFATFRGIDARSPYRMLMAVVGLTIVFPLLLQPVVRRLGDESGRPWAANTAALAAVIALWLALINRQLFWSLAAPAAVILACLALRRFRARFSRRDAILLPATLTVFLAIGDLTRGLAVEKSFFLAMVIVFAVRLAVAAIPSPCLPAFAFLASPFGLFLQTPFFARDQRYFGWHALAFVLVTPFILRFLVRNERRAATLAALVVYPLAVYSYATAVSLQNAEGKSRVNYFEAAHSLLPASEMLRGERPYRDILPGHGLIEDGLFDYLTLRWRDPSIGSALKARFVVSEMNHIALYALVTAATGIPEVGLAAPFLSFVAGYRANGLRELPALAGLTLIVLAVRRRRLRYFTFAGALVVLCGFTSLDFAAYTFLALVFAIARYPRRKDAFRAAAIGVVAASLPALVALVVAGIAGDFLRGTFFEVLTLGPAYALTPFSAPDALVRKASIPEIIIALLDRSSFAYVAWFLVLIYLAVMLARSPWHGPRRYEPCVIIAAWIVFSAISYAERHHLYFNFMMLGLLAALIFHLFRRRSPLAPIAVILLLATVHPTTHLTVAAMVRGARGPLEPGWVEISEPRRARGALFPRYAADTVASAKKYLDRMPPGQTFFDFTNQGVLYFIFDRDYPIRQYEVAYYQSAERQRDVIETLRRNPNVRAALVPYTEMHGSIDAIPNAKRAPLVWKYLQEHFEPAFREGEVSFWRRK